MFRAIYRWFLFRSISSKPAPISGVDELVKRDNKFWDKNTIPYGINDA